MRKDHSLTEILEKLRKNLHFQDEKRMFSKVFGKFKWILIEKIEDLPKDFPQNIKKMHKVHGEIKLEDYFLSQLMADSGKLDKALSFQYSNKFYGVCSPIIQGLKIYGFLILHDLKKAPSENLLEIFLTFTDTILREVQKELELKKMYDAIRPRAIALSTVHTVHRLINSTLNLNELLPRVARLTLQIMRATRCSIKLVDSKKKTLLPKSTVDLRTKMAELRKVEIGRFAPGKAVKYGKIVKGKDFLATPLVDEDIIGVITVYTKIDKTSFNDFDEEIMKTLCEQAVIAIKNAQLYKEQEKMTEGSIKSIAAILESKAAGSYLPSPSFIRLVRQMGQKLNMSELELKHLEYAATLHDAGQIMLPDKVTDKKGILTGEEYALIKEHPKKAAMILKPLKALKEVVPIILHHHENFDGSGYPSGFKGKEIPIGARIMGVVGSFEAMITKKTYRKAISINKAISEIKTNSGKQFDPIVVDAFVDVISRKSVISKIEKEIAQK